MTDSEITKARAAEKMLRATFETAKEREWRQVSAAAHARTVDAVWAARQSGVSVAQIAREYGTTSRGTIYDLLKEREAYTDLTTSIPTEPTITVEPFTDPNGYPNTYRVTVSNYGPTLYNGKIDVYRVNPEAPIMPMPDSFEPGAVLHSDIIKREPRIIDPIKEAMK